MKAFSTDYFYDDETKHEILPSEGMDLRDYFAARAMQGMLSSYEKGDSLKVQLFADSAYVMADAMMKARETK